MDAKLAEIWTMIAEAARQMERLSQQWEPNDPVALMIAELRERCRVRSLDVIEGNLVDEKTAADLLGLSPVSVRNRRQQFRGQQIPSVKIGGAYHYRLADIAEAILASKK